MQDGNDTVCGHWPMREPQRLLSDPVDPARNDSGLFHAAEEQHHALARSPNENKQPRDKRRLPCKKKPDRNGRAFSFMEVLKVSR